MRGLISEIDHIVSAHRTAPHRVESVRRVVPRDDTSNRCTWCCHQAPRDRVRRSEGCDPAREHDHIDRTHPTPHLVIVESFVGTAPKNSTFDQRTSRCREVPRRRTHRGDWRDYTRGHNPCDRTRRRDHIDSARHSPHLAVIESSLALSRRMPLTGEAPHVAVKHSAAGLY